jgi:outer membrane protein OmpA-like peptidoglycan-associated protein
MNPTPKSFCRFAAYLSFLLLLSYQKIQGQNFVPNPSFEDINTCAEFGQPCSPSAWFYLSRKFTTGYFPRFPSATGSRHLQIVAASRETENRQYWETMLLCPLQAGERYLVSLKIATPASKTRLSTVCPNLRDIGFWFTTHFVFVQGDSILQPRNYLSFTGATVRDLKNGWFEIKKEFVPTATASILIVGNFARMTNADILLQRNPSTPTIDILVDDISILRAKGGICSDYQQTKDSLYAILRRHSDNRPDDWHPRPVNHPVPGPEPQRKMDTANVTPPLPVADTIVLHNIQFDFDKYLIENPDTLQRYRSILTRPGIKKIQVVGFTDDAGSEAYNLDLSQKRAREIARLLSAKFDIPAALIETEGRGISRKYPTRDLNRRVEIYIFHEDNK